MVDHSVHYVHLAHREFSIELTLRIQLKKGHIERVVPSGVSPTLLNSSSKCWTSIGASRFLFPFVGFN